MQPMPHSSHFERKLMHNISALEQLIKESCKLLREITEETLWPTRCAICDTPGELLCRRCIVQLAYIDQLKSCPTCGAAHGKAICCECNHFILTEKHLDEFPLDGCISTVELTAETRRIITCYKDQGERHLARTIAQLMSESIPPSWRQKSVLVPIPAHPQAYMTRGFDHIQLIGAELCSLTNIPLASLLISQKQKDQRILNAQARLLNTRKSFSLAHNTWDTLERIRASGPLEHLIVFDDVMTTGATLFAAAGILKETLLASRCIPELETIYALSFARA